jgi:hypothetical protein
VNDERPPLPDTDDPFALLGVGEDVDERLLKRAYARLIRIYRPDESPAEFARIHAAFEAARGGTRAPVLAATPYRTDELTALADARDHAGLWARVRAADPDEDRGRLLRYAAALSWRYEGAAAMVAQLAEGAPRELVELAEAEVAIARRFAELRHHRIFVDGVWVPRSFVLPAPLVDLFANDLLDSPVERARSHAALASLLADPRSLLELADALFHIDRGLALHVTARIQAASPLWSDDLFVPPAVADALDRRLALEPPSWWPRFAAFAGLGALALIACIAYGLATDGVSNMTQLGVLAFAGSIGLFVKDHARGYAKRLRARLAAILADVGVPYDAITGWLRTHPGARLAGYFRSIQKDDPLALVGAIAALTREHERGDRLPEPS